MYFAVLLMTLGGLLSIFNWAAAIISSRSDRYISPAPVIGAALLGTGIYIYSGSIWWSLLAIPIDLGTLTLFLGIPLMIGDIWSTSEFNLVHEFQSQEGIRSISLKLYKNDTACFRLELHPRIGTLPSELEFLSMGLAGQWTTTDTGFQIPEYGNGRTMNLIGKGDSFTAEEHLQNEEKRDATLMHGLLFVRTPVN